MHRSVEEERPIGRLCQSDRAVAADCNLSQCQTAQARRQRTGFELDREKTRAEKELDQRLDHQLDRNFELDLLTRTEPSMGFI